MAKGKEIKITIRLTAEEKERLKKLAEVEGLSLSDLVRKKLQGVRIRRKPQTEQEKIKREWLYELHRIGVNVNQIARTANKLMRTAKTDKNFQEALKVLQGLSQIEEELRTLTEVVK